MRKRMAIFLLIFLLTLSLCACAETVPQDEGLHLQVPGLPEIEDFSGLSYEEFPTMYPPIESAVLRCGGEETAIAADDPRLIRLLNFLLYSESEELTAIQQSYVPADEIDSLLQSGIPLLDITFVHQYVPNNMRISPFLPRMIICGNSYLTFVYNKEGTPAPAERFWPYQELIWQMAKNGQAENDVMADGAWDSEHWINLLQYAGF